VRIPEGRGSGACTRVGSFRCPGAARNDLAAVLSPAEARASVTVGDEAGVPVDEHLAGA